MPTRLAIFITTLGATALLFAGMPLVAQGAESPWWQVLTGSHPTNLWKATDNVQEITTTMASTEFGEGTVQQMEVNGEFAGCLGSQTFLGEFGCAAFFGSPAISTDSQLEAALETVYGTSDVDVTGGPVGDAPFVVTVPGRNVSSISFNEDPAQPHFGTAVAKVISEGGSGRLVLTVTNIGDAPVVANSEAVTIVDELPEGVEATGVEGFSGVFASARPVDCAVEAANLVACTFEDVLPSYEAIEVEILASLTGDPPAAVAPGKVTVSGGNAAATSAVQEINVSPDPPSFGIEGFSARFEEEGGSGAGKAGRHPFQMTTTIQLNSGKATLRPNAAFRDLEVEQPALPRNLRFPLPAGFIGNAQVMPKCKMQDFFERPEAVNLCREDSAIGVATATVIESMNFGHARLAVPVFNLPPASGEPARFGFVVAGVPVVIGTSVDSDDDYRVVAEVRNVSQLATLLSSTVVLWGTPGDSRHDSSRGWNCVYNLLDLGPCERPATLGDDAFLRLPVSCVGPLEFGAEAEPWNVPPGSLIARSAFAVPALSACNQIPFDPAIGVEPGSKRAAGPSGLAFQLHMPDTGLLSKDAIAEGQAKKVEVTLPEGITVNPSQANGLGACSPGDYARETAQSAPGDGCPEASKIGTVAIRTPLLEEEAHGSVYVATPHDNPFGSLLALYMVAKIPERGVLFKQAGKVELDPETGQIVTTFDDLPQIPFDTFDLDFFGGDRAPLVMPSACGRYDAVVRFTPWHASNPDSPLPGEIVTRTSQFSIDQGADGGICPSGASFKPTFTAGTLNNAAGSYSPFDARLTRKDGEQEFTRFSIKLPQGLLGKLAGIPFCPEAAIAAARARTGPNGGQEELEHSSCPGASEIGQTLVGAGVGSTLTYAPGKLYLAGPYQGSKLSVVAITTAKVGPFDLGTVVIRQALGIDPETAEVSTDGSSSNPIPHILQGVVVHVRDIRINVDRRNFVLNPTSCERMSVAASVAGSAQPVEVSAPFQAADCASLGFKPKLSLGLSGGTGRGDNPRLKAVVRARKGDANIGAAVVTLPHSAFLDQAHIRTVCTRVQFNAGEGNGERCPKGSIYGRVRAVSPLLDEQLRGPVYLRSSNHPLPDLVAALHSRKVDINLDGRIDSVGNGRIRNIFQAMPDAPVTKFTLEMQGGRKGLLVNSTNICLGKHRARATFTGQNGKRRAIEPLVKAKCGAARKRHSR